MRQTLSALCLSVCLVSLSACVAPAPYAPAPSYGVVVTTRPPPVRVEVVGRAPYSGAVWVKGHWVWRSGRWVWAPGYWARPPRAGVGWVPGHWVHRPNGRWVWVDGYWR
ncbi:MAG: YXWGXW repeat-containing protein [Gammaproteobacteria bacterium]